MSRLYPGSWSVRVVFEYDGELLTEDVGPMSYEDAERLCFGFGLGIPHSYGLRNVRVTRARIVAG